MFNQTSCSVIDVRDHGVEKVVGRNSDVENKPRDFG